jgi:N-acetylglucosaminyl-diphospho-decaprenol L-rhamnosyltransferase
LRTRPWLPSFVVTRPLAPLGPARYGAGLAVLVVGTGDEPFPDATLPPAARTAGPGRRLVLVDSGTPGGVPAVTPDATVLRVGEDVGRGPAVNRAVAALPADIGFVAVAPPGLHWCAGTLDTLCAAAARHPRAGILAPRLCDAAGATVASAHPLPRPGRAVLAVLARRPWPPTTADHPTEGPVGWSSAPGLLLRRVALDSVDGFDPRYPGQLDDLDLADRLARAGWLTVHVPAAVVVHPAGRRPDSAAPRRYLTDRIPRPVRPLLRATGS